MQIGSTIALSPVEQTLCEIVATLRHDNNRSQGVSNSKRGSQSDFQTDLEGFAAELAFCKLLNLYPDLTIEPRTSTSDTGDVKLPDGRTVDIKVTRYATGKLIAVPWKKAGVDLFALMVGQFPCYTFRGVMDSQELLAQERLGDLGYGPTFIANQEELKDIF
jgi:hypothetical protein